LPKGIFNVLSPIYDWIIRGAPPQKLPEYLGLSGNCDERILEVGAGTGRAVKDLIDQCRSLWLLDPSQNMLHVAKKKIPRAKTVHAYAERIPFPDKFFDRIFAVDSFHHWDNHLQALMEIRRVLNEKGRLVIIDFDPSTKKGHLIKSMEKALKMGSTFFTPRQLQSLLKKSGLTIHKQFFVDSGTYLVIVIPSGELNNPI
jgi:demethylmenaquinone methyltransferase/2-methoxy-6-polyprenyl-1,4-benzoquinol methylase